MFPSGLFLLSNSSIYKLNIGTDGNLVFSNTSSHQILWTSDTAGATDHYFLFVSKKGKLTLIDIDLNIIWQSPISSSINMTFPPFQMSVNDDGTFAVTDSQNQILWSSAT